MDPRTIQFYKGKASEIARRYTQAPSAAARYFAVAFTAGSRILDVGCGSGRDLQALIDAGYDATGGRLDLERSGLPYGDDLHSLA